MIVNEDTHATPQYIPFTMISLYQNTVDVCWLVHSTTALGTDKASQSTECHFDEAQLVLQDVALTSL